MSKFATKFAAGILAATTVVSLSGFGSFAGIASAQTMDTATLMAQIQALQAQLLAMQGGSMATTACSFTRDLMVGSKGADVTCLQNALGISPATGYFGAITKAKVMAWQSSHGVSATGYFGPKSRAAFASSMTSMPSNPSNPTTPTTPSAPVNPTNSLWVAAAAGSPTGSAIAGAGQINVGRFSFTAPATMGVTVTGLTFNKVGVVSDSNISNLYLADVATGAVVAQFQSLTQGVATFSGLMLNVAAGQTWWGELRADISTSATSGNTLAFDLTGATTSGNVAVAGLPVKGNLLTVTSVNNPAIATLTLTANAVGSTIDAGTNSVLVSSWTANVSNSAVNLKNLQFSFVGSANPGDIRNLRLLINGTQVATLPTAATETVFSIANNPIQLKTGQSTIQIFADVAGSPNRTFTFSLLQPYKVNAMDTQYGAGITASITSTSQTTITINTGSVTTQVSTDSGSGPIPSGASSVTVAKFTIYAAGEPVKVQFLDAVFTGTNVNWSASTTNDLTNARLIDDVGGQVGNALSTLTSGTSSGQCTLATTTATCHFGTSGSPINYIIPANTTRTLSLMVDIGSATTLTTLSGSLPAMSSNLQGQTSFASASSGAATGATRSVNSSPLTIAANSGLVAPTYIAGTNQAKIASFVLTASSAQSAQISSLTFDKDSNTDFDMQNMTVKVGSTQFGTTRSTIGDAETSIAFSASTPITVAAGGSVTVDVYADILTTTTATSHSTVIDLVGWSALGGTSNSAITFPGATNGQSITISSGPTLTVAIGSNTAAAKNVVMGSTNNELFTVRLTADNVDDIRIVDLIVRDTITSGSAGVASFQNATLWDGTTQLAGPLALTSVSAASNTITFALQGAGLVVPKNGSKELTVKADVPSFSSGGAVSGSSHIFKVNANADLGNGTTNTVKSVGSPTATVTVTGAPAVGNAIAVYRTKLTVTATPGSTQRSRQLNDELGTLNFSADSAYQAVIGTVAIKFAGTAVSNGSTAFTVDLIDTTTGVALTGASQQTCTPGAGNSCSVTFNPSYTVSAGTTKNVKVRVNSSSFYDATNNTENLTAVINAAGDVRWSDGTTSNVSLESTSVPVTILGGGQY